MNIFIHLYIYTCVCVHEFVEVCGVRDSHLTVVKSTHTKGLDFPGSHPSSGSGTYQSCRFGQIIDAH